MENTRKRGAENSTGRTNNTAPDDAATLRPYSRPQVLSSERLEASAATCDGTGGFGKTIPVPCGILGS